MLNKGLLKMSEHCHLGRGLCPWSRWLASAPPAPSVPGREPPGTQRGLCLAFLTNLSICLDSTLNMTLDQPLRISNLFFFKGRELNHSIHAKKNWEGGNAFQRLSIRLGKPKWNRLTQTWETLETMQTELVVCVHRCVYWANSDSTFKLKDDKEIHKNGDECIRHRK